MLKLILHHEYTLADGVAIDSSDHGNHGVRTNTSFLPSGYKPFSGALQFNGISSRVTIRHNPTLTDLNSVMVEAWINPGQVDKRRNIIEGDDSFAIYLAPPGGVGGGGNYEGVLHGDFREHGGNWIPLFSESPYSPDGITHTVPRNTWSKVTYFHDGIASAVLMINDKVVAERYDIRSRVGPVGNRDLIIGSWTIDDRYPFLGSIDEVKLWKYDPEGQNREFFCRLKDRDTLDCLVRGYTLWFSGLDRPTIQRYASYIRCLNRIVENIIRTVFSHGREAKGTWEDYHSRYLELWCKNAIYGHEMKELMQGWEEWLCNLVGPDTVRTWILQGKSCQAELGTGPDHELLKIWKECDPDMVRYFDLVVESWSRCLK